MFMKVVVSWEKIIFTSIIIFLNWKKKAHQCRFLLELFTEEWAGHSQPASGYAPSLPLCRQGGRTLGRLFCSSRLLHHRCHCHRTDGTRKTEASTKQEGQK